MGWKENCPANIPVAVFPPQPLLDEGSWEGIWFHGWICDSEPGHFAVGVPQDQEGHGTPRPADVVSSTGSWVEILHLSRPGKASAMMGEFGVDLS